MNRDSQSQQRSVQVSRKRVTDSNPSLHKSEHRRFKRDQPQTNHKLVFEAGGGLPDGTKFYYKSRKDFMGEIQGNGIYCFCCKKTVSPSEFEYHAGSSLKKPYENILLTNGMSLHQYACGLVKKENDVICRVCKTGGDLSCCHVCRRPVHKECLAENSTSKNVCKYCYRFKKCVGSSKKKIPKRCCKSDPVACALCRSHNFVKGAFCDGTVIICDQCEKEYHVGCLRKHEKANLKELPKGNWYCTQLCQDLHDKLEHLVQHGPQKIPGYLLNIIRNKLKEGDADSITNCDMSFVLVRGKDASENNKRLLGEAVEIFQDQFKPIIDSVTEGDFITSMAYGRKLGNFVFKEVHTTILMIDSKVVVAGMFRAFGKETAELSIVATRQSYQRKGYFHIFFKCFKKLLPRLNIQKLVIPASHDARVMWMEKFGFKDVAPEQMKEYSETQTSMVAFRETSLLEKEVPKRRTT